ncbi:MAG: DNA polymerase III subunit epsilon [Parachlamydia sp.]|nr:MAG: DNA polymerase III subunit epsilon [Parachlamydia sp.]
MSLKPLFYDTETTGVRADKDRVIELAVYDPETNRTFERLINPGVPIPPEATAIHHISDDMVAQAPSFAEIIEEFKDFCAGDVVLVAHNNDQFDVHFLRNEFFRCQQELPSWKFFDTLKWARRYRPDLPRHTLQSLRNVYGIAENNAHRALDDVLVLYQVYMNMIDDLSMDEAYALLNQPKDIQHMPFGKHQGALLKDVPAHYVKWLANTGAFDKAENAQLRNCFEKLGLLVPA